MQYFLEHSEDYGYSWSQYTAPAFCSREDIKAELADARKKSLDNGGDRRKMRFRINVVEPTRPLPELAFVDSWLEAFETGKNELVKWLNENYVGRKFEDVDTPIVRVEFHSASDGNVWVGFFDKTDVNMYYKLTDLKNIKFKNE